MENIKVGKSIEKLRRFFDGLDVCEYNLYPFFKFDENGVPAFKEIELFDTYIEENGKKEKVEQELEEFISYYSFIDYFLRSSTGLHVLYLSFNSNYNDFCNNKLLINTNKYNYDFILSNHFSKIEIFLTNMENLPLGFPLNVKTEDLQKYIKKDTILEKRLKYNYLVILFISYIRFKEIYANEGSSCFSDIFSQMYEAQENMKEHKDLSDKIYWDEGTKKITDNQHLLVLLAALTSAGYIKTEKGKTNKIFSGLSSLIASHFKVNGKSGVTGFNNNNVDKISSEIREIGKKGEGSEVGTPFDEKVLEDILSEVIERLRKVKFKKYDDVK